MTRGVAHSIYVTNFSWDARYIGNTMGRAVRYLVVHAIRYPIGLSMKCDMAT